MTNDIIDTQLRDRIAMLLKRYPALPPAETGEIIDFLKTGPAVDRGMLKGDPTYAPKIARVQADHPDAFRLGIARQLLIAAMIALPFIALCVFIMDKGA